MRYDFHQPKPPARWQIAIWLLLTILAYGLVGKMDYEAERALECAQLDKTFNPVTDECEADDGKTK